MTDERWLPVPDHDAYEVSDLGRVRRSKPGRGARVGHILSQILNREEDGYLYVCLSGGARGLQKKLYVHRLVALAFMPEGVPGVGTVDMEVHHEDTNTTRNVLGNLEWKTPSANKRLAWITRRRMNGKARLSDPAPWET